MSDVKGQMSNVLPKADQMSNVPPQADQKSIF